MSGSITYTPGFGRALNQGYSVSDYSTKITLPFLDVRYWFLQFPMPQLASAVHVDNNTLSIKCAWANCDDLISLCWSTEDAYDHPLAAYSMSKDYSKNTWTFTVSFDSGIIPFDQPNGMTLTINNAAGTSYVRLWNYMVSGTNTSATFTIDFGNLQSGYAPGGPLVDCTTISSMFISFANTQFGNGVKLTAMQYSTVTFQQNSYTGPGLSVNLPQVANHGIQMTIGYDDLYNQTPKRLVDQMVNLGYQGNCTMYIGMSHFMKLGWSASEQRFSYTLQAQPINDATMAWFQEMYNRLAAVGINLIFSMSYEMLYEYIPYAWCQLDYQGNPAKTGWEPPSSLMAFTNTQVMQHLKNTAAQCLSVVPTNAKKFFQVGEPWWWDGSYSNGQPCFYDPATTALFAAQNPGVTMYQFTTVNDPVTDPNAIFTANWLNLQLGNSTLAIQSYVKGLYINVECCVLFFTPQIFGSPVTKAVNFPVNEWRYPQWDFFQLECYDDVTQGNIQAQDQQLRQVIGLLQYPEQLLQYFAGFVLYHAAAEATWPLIYQGMVDAYVIGIQTQAIWSYSQIVRDGILMQVQTGVSNAYQPSSQIVGVKMFQNSYSFIRANYIPVVVWQQNPSSPSVSLPDWLSSAYIDLYDNITTYTQYQVTDSDLGNPDIIAYTVYGEEQYDWLIMDFNGIVDPYNDLYIGQVLRIPDLQSAIAYLKQNTGINVTSNLNQIVTL